MVPAHEDELIFDLSILRGKNSQERREILIKSLNIDESNLPSLPLPNSSYADRETLLSVSNAIYDGIMKTWSTTPAKACRLINGSTVGSLLFDHPEYETARDSANRATYTVFKDDAKELSALAKNAMDISSFAALRELTAAAHQQRYLNLAERNKQWDHKVTFSDLDILRRVRIPGIDVEQAFLLGVVTIAGSLNTPKTPQAAEESKNHNTHEVCISYRQGPEGDGRFIQDIVAPLMRNSFGLKLGSDYLNDRRLRANSQAVTTFMRNGLGISSCLTERSYMNFNLLSDEALLTDTERLERAYLAGIISKKLLVNKDKRGVYGTINVANIGLASQIQAAAKRQGLDFTLQSRGRLNITNGQLESLLTTEAVTSDFFSGHEHKGYMYNPMTLDRLKTY